MERIKENSYCFPDKVGVVTCKEKTRTQQNLVNETDINKIVARAVKTGILGDPAAISARQAIFGDFSQVGSYHDALNKVLSAQSAFIELPVDVRNRFGNDPGKLMEFLADPANVEEAIELGLMVKKEDAEAGVPASEVPPATPTSTPTP